MVRISVTAALYYAHIECSMIATAISWTDANQAYLVTELACLKRRLAGESNGSPRSENNDDDSPPAIDRLADLFGLSNFEREVLLLCAGVEMDSELAALCAQAQGYPQRTYATFGLSMSLLREPHWSALTPSRPLRQFRLLEAQAGLGLASAPLRIDERILHYVAGINAPDSRLLGLMRMSAFPDWIAGSHRAIAAKAGHLLAAQVLLHLCGDDPQGQEDVACVAAHETGRQLFVLRAEELPAPGSDLDQIAVLWQREALLLPGALMIQCASAGLTPSARHLIEKGHGSVIVASREPVRLDRYFIRFDVDKPTPAEQRLLWQRAIVDDGQPQPALVDALSEQFRLSAKTIFSACPAVRTKELWSVCRSMASPKLEDLAQRIEPRAGWEDLVLPEPQIAILRQLTSQVRHRMKVYEEWGFAAKSSRGLGVNALFAGESGTGKTLAAEVLARELDLDVYRIDLSAVVSKYIGETEKNLKKVFDAAEEGGVLLLFDEADALFGKRSEVKDSHDRYANIEVSYLLQRIEAYQGLAILTTNLKSAVDRAFQRRLRFIVNFPFPDAAQREAIWRRVFPAGTPGEGLDGKKLAQLNVAGGNIRNIALNAAFLAAEAGGPVNMRRVLEAARLEAQKMERPLSEAETRGWI